MDDTGYERLSPLDASFLALESPATHMHVAGVARFEAGPLAGADGAIDVERISRYIASRLHYVPRYRQRLARIPVERAPVWVDDDRFSIDYHVRHSSLPRPGSDEQLKQVAGRIISIPLDRSKPLWELWVVEGLEGGRFAVITKIHHCMIDGIASVDLMAVLLGAEPTLEIEAAPAWTPRRAPSGAALMAGEAGRRMRRVADGTRNLRRTLSDSQALLDRFGERLQAVAHSLASGWLVPASRTSLNDEIGPNRRFEWLELELGAVKEIKNRLGGSVNDVVLAIVAGAVRRFLMKHRSEDPSELDFRVMAPVSVRAPGRRGEMGNQVAMWLVPLPLAEPDPVARLAIIRQETMELKRSDQALGAATVVQVAGNAPATLVSLGARLAAGGRPFNMTVTNVPGPQFPLYLLGSRLLAQYPMVPLWHNHGVGVALFSYDGRMAWGLNADWDVVPDLTDFAAAIRDAFEELAAAAKG